MASIDEMKKLIKKEVKQEIEQLHKKVKQMNTKVTESNSSAKFKVQMRNRLQLELR